jgi:hypothetical protein
LRRAQLKIANRRIVEQGVARNVIEGSVARDQMPEAERRADHRYDGRRTAW